MGESELREAFLAGFHWAKQRLDRAYSNVRLRWPPQPSEVNEHATRYAKKQKEAFQENNNGS